MNTTTTSLLRAAALFAATLLCAARLPAASVMVGGTGVSDCTFWCVDRLQQVYDSSLFSGLSEITQVGFAASPTNGTAWDGIGTWQMSLSTSPNSVALLDTTFANNVGPDNAVFATITPPAGTPPLFLLVPFNGSFIYDPGQGDLLVDIVRVAGSAIGVGMDGGIGANINRVYAYNSTITADGGNQNGYAIRTLITSNPVPEPSTIALLGIGAIVLMASRRRRE